MSERQGWREGGREQQSKGRRRGGGLTVAPIGQQKKSRTEDVVVMTSHMSWW